jgi:hypothetical protein
MDFDPINPFGAPTSPTMLPPIKGQGAVMAPMDMTMNNPNAVSQFGVDYNDNESQFRGSTMSKKKKKKVKKMKKKIVVQEKEENPDDDF